MGVIPRQGGTLDHCTPLEKLEGRSHPRNVTDARVSIPRRSVGPAFTSQSDPLRRKGAFAKKISRARNFRNDGHVIAFLSNPRDWKGGDLETTKTTLCYNSHFSPIFLYYSYLFSIYFHQFFSHFPFTIYHNYPRYYKIYIYKITPAILYGIFIHSTPQPSTEIRWRKF